MKHANPHRNSVGREVDQGPRLPRPPVSWYLLLVLPYLALLYPPLYSRYEPTLFSFPFFYWYQFLWVPLSALSTGLAYYLMKRGR
ncbi:DUF3311 domain-containing protein [Geomonas sp. Red875]|uniref:DUF3311 domain-containing protein n=1 Tax=Geomesophilobacter sediminis TaxID=2798584 RepID=A0A8J7M089_9BACT|nr:DUF3311 domain-containing protein [Geomesophilobacter sediminis]